MGIKVKVKILDEGRGLPLPGYMTEGSAGMDLYAAIPDTLQLDPGDIKLIPTGIAIELPRGFEAQIRPRSGLALKHGITLLNSPGTIDSDYRGMISVIAVNFGKEPFILRRGERIAQMVIAKVYRAELIESLSLTETERGDGGFGHTGRYGPIILWKVKR